jgi:YD repeat-containing protein
VNLLRGRSTYAYNASDQLIGRNGNKQFTYDANGNMLITPKGVASCEQANNRLVFVDRPRTVYRYTYDGDGKRLSAGIAGALPLLPVRGDAPGRSRTGTECRTGRWGVRVRLCR